MPKKPPTETDHVDAHTMPAPSKRPLRRGPSKAPRTPRREALATSPQLARIENALRDALDAAFHLAHDHAASAPERACIRRVRRTFLSSTRAAPEFEDLAVTADALLRAFEKQFGTIDPRVSALLVHEVATFLSASSTHVRVPRMPTPRRPLRDRLPHSFTGERFYGLA